MSGSEDRKPSWLSGDEDRKPSCPPWGGGARLGGLEGILENWGVADPAGGQVGSAQQTRYIQHWVNVSWVQGPVRLRIFKFIFKLSLINFH